MEIEGSSISFLYGNVISGNERIYVAREVVDFIETDYR